MNEEYAFINPYELLDRGFDKNDFAKIIRFLQEDRKEWINQYTKAHNDYVVLQSQNEFLTKRENKLQTIQQLFKSGSVDLDKLREIVLEEE